jgi:hypothetical protein
MDRVGPITIFDKSALQALTIDEAVWFDAFFMVNVVPVFYVETLANLEKEVGVGKTPEDVVGLLAEKTPSNAYPNAFHNQLVVAEILGEKIPMDGQVVVGAGDVRRAADGKLGVHVDRFPEHVTLDRWRNHDFLAIERDVAKGWRAELAAHDPERLADVLKNILPDNRKLSTIAELKEFIDSFCVSNDRRVVSLALDLVAPPKYKAFALARWKDLRKPTLPFFLPYTTHVFKVDLLYYLGVHRGFISGERASNKADMAYLYYLPFSMVFTSGDRLHRLTAPLFLRDDQVYLPADELKAALRELDAHYDALPEPIKELGVMQFAAHPPPDMDNAVTRLWDKYIAYDWREKVRDAEAKLWTPPGAATDGGTVDELRERIESAQPTGQTFGTGFDPDYVVVRRLVPVKKGKWRMVSKEVEEAGDGT